MKKKIVCFRLSPALKKIYKQRFKFSEDFCTSAAYGRT